MYPPKQPVLLYLHHAGCVSLCVIHSDLMSLHTHCTQTQGCVYQTSSQPFDHTWLRSELPRSFWANNTSHVQVSINRSFDGGCWEFQGGGVYAGIPGVPTGGGGGVWSSLGLEERSGGLDGVGETFHGSVFIEADASPHWSHRAH